MLKLAAVLAGLLLVLAVFTWAPIRNPIENWLFRGVGGRGCFGMWCAERGPCARDAVTGEYRGEWQDGTCVPTGKPRPTTTENDVDLRFWTGS